MFLGSIIKDKKGIIAVIDITSDIADKIIRQISFNNLSLFLLLMFLKSHMKFL